MSEYENFCNSYKGSVNMSELLNFSRNYSDGFFNSNCLYVAPVELESSADRVSFRGLSYAISSQVPCVQYQKSKDSNQSKGVCLMLIEVPLKMTKKSIT